MQAIEPSQLRDMRSGAADLAAPVATPVLIVDLDGDLLRGGLGPEQFWAAMAENPRHLWQRRAQIRPEIASLPYEPRVLDHISNWRDGGGIAVLRSGHDPAMSQAIATHLGLFEAVIPMDPADTTYDETGTHIPLSTARTPGYASYLKALRPHQYAKNALIFLPMIAAHDLSLATVVASLMGFVAFCLIASSVYVLNDLMDLAADRAHPRKCMRPFASGAIPLSHGTPMLVGLLGGGIVIAALTGPLFLAVMALYYTLTLAYSTALKRKVVVDICVLAALYTFRIMAGGAATGIPLSVWLLAFSMFLFFSLACVKRQAELVDMKARHLEEASGRGYRVEDLPIVTGMAMASGYISVLVMMLYINSPAVTALYPTPAALLGICCMLLFWVSRMIMVTHRGDMHDDPVVYAARDGTSRLCFLICIGCTIGGALV